MPSPDTAPQVEHPALSPKRENMTREDRIKHNIARQFALGPLGDPTVTGLKLRRDPYSNEIGNNIPMSASIAESTDPYKTWDTQVLDPRGVFASPQEFALLVRQYRLELTQDPVAARRIAMEEEEIVLGQQRQEEIWTMEIAARDRKLADERNRTLAALDARDESRPPQDVFVAEGFDDQRAA
ncbi:MAG: hypothetical protein KBD51_00885 [Candidatus Levybacteria bacterium]|nr:hypothetical protein [Candidatus Levybacteria bacterium]